VLRVTGDWMPLGRILPGMAGVWSGYMTFGLVTLPVRLYAGARGERVSFHLLHAPDRQRLKQQMICPKDGAVVPRGEAVRGYEYAKGEYVVVAEAAIQAAAPKTERELQIVEFCRQGEIDPVWFEASYYLMPEKAGQRPYGLLLEAMRRTGTWAVAQLTMHNREYLSLVRPTELAGVPEEQAGKGPLGLMLHTMFYVDELRVAEGFGAAHAPEGAEAELKLAQQLIEGMTRRFDPARFHDHYRENLERLVEAAMAGKPAPKRAAAAKLAPVTDIMASLKASLARQAGAAKAGAGKPAARRRRPAA
jgi:DNA end-binding protein Ku